MQLLQLAGEGAGVAASRQSAANYMAAFSRKPLRSQPRWATQLSFNGLTRRNCSRTSEVVNTIRVSKQFHLGHPSGGALGKPIQV